MIPNTGPLKEFSQGQLEREHSLKDSTVGPTHELLCVFGQEVGGGLGVPCVESTLHMVKALLRISCDDSGCSRSRK